MARSRNAIGVICLLCAHVWVTVRFTVVCSRQPETMPGDHTWECPCGKFVAKLSGPPAFDFNCHCHSCVAPARYLDAKFPAGQTALVGGAVGKVFWLLKDIELPEGDGLSFLKVGPDGENIRAFTSCCGQPL